MDAVQVVYVCGNTDRNVSMCEKILDRARWITQIC
jgi:hypothetical protein